MQFQLGDVVQLKSGGPPMTVTYVNEKGRVSCAWFNRVEGGIAWEPKHETFPPEALKKSG